MVPYAHISYTGIGTRERGIFLRIREFREISSLIYNSDILAKNSKNWSNNTSADAEVAELHIKSLMR